MRDFTTWINESVLPNVQRALDTLKERKDQKDLVSRIQKADPYQDKRFAPVIANWVLKLGITPEEHLEDVKQFKQLHRRLKDLRVPANNRKRTAHVKELLSRKPEDFAGHYSTLQLWNREASDILDPQKDLSDDGLPVEMRHGGYTMYRIDTKEHCQAPLIKNSMSWCITKGSFGEYGGPPYYPIVRDRDRSPFAMIIPAHFDRDPDQAVRNAQNTARLSPAGLKPIRPLVQHVLPLDGHDHPYINGIHGIKHELPEHPSAKQALDTIRDHTLEPGEWPEGEQAISKDAESALEYAQDVLEAPFPAGEPAISKYSVQSCEYAQHVLKGPFPAGEEAISQDADYACYYALHVLKGPFPLGERAISQDAYTAFVYAKDVLKGRFPAGEPAIRQNSSLAKEYDRLRKSLWLPQ